MPSLSKWTSTLQETAVATEHFFRAVTGDHLENGVDVYDWVVRVKHVGDDEAAGGGLEDGEGDGTGDLVIVVVEEKGGGVVVGAEIGIAVPLH